MGDLTQYIQQNYTFAKIPTSVKQSIGNSRREWEKAVIEYSLSHQLRWKKNIVRKVVEDEKKYYEELQRYSQERLMLYPYHLADVMAGKLRTTPFDYYHQIFCEMLRSEKSYDSLPNFSAGDGLRLLGIGRNQYIDIMNQSRSKGFFRKKVNPKLLLPAQPVEDIHIEWWWKVSVGYVTEDDVKKCNPDEHRMVDRLIDRGTTLAGVLDKNLLRSLYRRGYVYLSVPIADDDLIIVPPLEGFVMNRVLGDYFENLLYKVFVSIDEHTTIKQLAGVLRIEPQLVKDAVSVYCRLGFALKKSFDKVPPGGDWHTSWRVDSPSKKNAPSLLDPLRPPEMQKRFEDIVAPITTAGVEYGKRIALMFDSTLTAFLMMGNLSAGLKTHAVTMFEAGKLSEESMDSFVTELCRVDALSEGETQRYFDHARTLRQSVSFLRHNAGLNVDPQQPNGLGLDLLRCESLNSLDAATCSRVLQKNYALLVSMAPLSKDIRSVMSCDPGHVGPAVPEMTSVWFKLWMYTKMKAGPPCILFPAGTRVNFLPEIFTSFRSVTMTTWTHEGTLVTVPGLLSALNDALLHSPVLVEGHSYVGHAFEVETFYLPFPFIPTAELSMTSEQQQQLAGLEANKSIALIDLNDSNVCDNTNTESSTDPPDMRSFDPLAASPEKDKHGISNDAANKGTEDVSESTPLSSSAYKRSASGKSTLEQDHILEDMNDPMWEKHCVALHNLPLVQKLKDLLHLDNAFGYLTLVRQQDDGGASMYQVAAPVTEIHIPGRDWNIVDVNFGLPLFDHAVNTAVCQSIREKALLSAENVKKLTTAHRSLSLELLDFVSSNQNLDLNFDASLAAQNHEISYPTHCIQCVDGILTTFDPSSPLL